MFDPVCMAWYRGCSVNWDAVDAIGGVLAVGIAAWVFKHEVDRYRRERQQTVRPKLYFNTLFERDGAKIKRGITLENRGFGPAIVTRYVALLRDVDFGDSNSTSKVADLGQSLGVNFSRSIGTPGIWLPAGYKKTVIAIDYDTSRPPKDPSVSNLIEEFQIEIEYTSVAEEHFIERFRENDSGPREAS